jgi:hypothetical protein
MATKRLVFGEWQPDQPGLTGAITDALNVVPELSSYGPLPSVSDLSNNASEPLITTFIGKFGDTVQQFAVGETKIFQFTPNDLNLVNVSKTGDYTGVVSLKVTQFGKVLLAANGNNVLQSWTIGISTEWDDASASAPTAKFVTVVRDFVVASGNSSFPNRVFWSDINDETNWVAGPTSQSDIQDLPDGGNVQGLAGGEFGLVFLERAIYRMSYIGSPLFFQFDAITRTLGCFEPNSIVQQGGRTFFLSDDGFYVCDGQAVTPIGAEKIDRWFFDDVDEGKLDKMSTAVDPEKHVIVWCYPNTSGGQSMLLYNWQTNRWSHAITTANFISNAATVGTTLEQLNIYGAIESVPASFDSRIWAGGKPIFAGVRANKIILFGGLPMAAEIVSGDVEEGLQSIIKLAYPQIDGGSGTVSVASRFRLDQGLVFSPEIAASGENRVPLRSIGRYHRLKIKPTGQWTDMMAVDIEIQQVSGR